MEKLNKYQYDIKNKDLIQTSYEVLTNEFIPRVQYLNKDMIYYDLINNYLVRSRDLEPKFNNIANYYYVINFLIQTKAIIKVRKGRELFYAINILEGYYNEEYERMQLLLEKSSTKRFSRVVTYLCEKLDKRKTKI